MSDWKGLGGIIGFLLAIPFWLLAMFLNGVAYLLSGLDLESCPRKP